MARKWSADEGIHEVPPSPRRPLTFGEAVRYAGLAIVGVTALGRGLAATGIFKKPMGAYAEKRGQCRGGVLLPLQEGGVPAQLGGICSAQCNRDGDCGSRDFRCYEGSCAPTATKDFGETCRRQWECKSSQCVTVLARPREDSNPSDPAWIEAPKSTCAVVCGIDHACPHGYACRSFRDRHLCAPDDSP